MATIRARSELDNKPFRKGVKGMSKSVGGFQKQLGSIKGLVAGAFGVGAIVGLTRRTIAFGSELSDLATQAGLTTDEFQALEIASIRAGVSSDKIRTTMAKLNVVIGQAKSGMKTYVDLFKRAGITMEQVERMNPAQVFEQLARTITTAERGTSEFGAVMELLGTRSAAQLTEVMQELTTKGFGGLIAEAKAAGQVLDKDVVKRLDTLEDKLQLASRQLRVGFAPVIEFAADSTVKLADKLKGGQDALVSLVDAFAERKAAGGGGVIGGIKALFGGAGGKVGEGRAGLIEDAGRKLASKIKGDAAKIAKAKADAEAKAKADADAEAKAKADAKAIANAEELAKKEVAAAAKIKAISEGKGTSASKEISDRLSRIGGFIGGQASPEARTAQRSISIQSKTLAAIEKLPENLREIVRSQYT